MYITSDTEITFGFLVLVKRERMLKKRMKMKKKKKKKKKEAKDALEKLNSAEYKVRVVTAFRASKDNDLDLTVGDEVTVLLKVYETSNTFASAIIIMIKIIIIIITIIIIMWGTK